MKVIILRGISGSGKSTWTKKNHPEAVVASADHYFINEEGVYQYDPTAIHEAHKACYRTFMEAAMQRRPLIIIDNVNATARDIAPYVASAEYFGYEAEILTLLCDPEIAIQRKQIVPPEKTRRIAQILTRESQHFPPHMKRIHKTLNAD